MGNWIAIAEGYAYGIFDSEDKALTFLKTEFPDCLDTKVYELISVS